ncbi:MAG: flagellar assembly peptidoglycan hydrolase FlgJ [Pseudorhodoplanes sp.]|uniref:flagellar assembly peptidoglycan hydrolase FlgJ n=1 Tax=Pseudorhodoplanes sp. TaxID=1934341 RepID=UPI003D1141BD
MAAAFDLKAASSVKSAYAALTAQQQLAGAKSASTAKARQASEDFEAVYLNTMFSQMFTAIDGDGPFGGGKALGVWRSFLTDAYAKSFAKSGGIGIASDVYRTLMAQQEDRGAAPAAETTP